MGDVVVTQDDDTESVADTIAVQSVAATGAGAALAGDAAERAKAAAEGTEFQAELATNSAMASESAAESAGLSAGAATTAATEAGAARDETLSAIERLEATVAMLAETIKPPPAPEPAPVTPAPDTTPQKQHFLNKRWGGK